MKDMQKQSLKRWFLLVLTILVTSSLPLFAEEPSDAASPENTESTQPQGNEQNQKARFEEFLSKHPKAAEKMDRNGDGSIDDMERKQGRRMMEERARKMRAEQQQGNLNEPQSSGDSQAESNSEYSSGENSETQGEYRQDNDNNPPGKAGGPGTNWENRPGPQGGSGAGPNINPGGAHGGGPGAGTNPQQHRGGKPRP